MSTNQTSTKWMTVIPCPTTDEIGTPTGIDRNNYIVINYDWARQIKCIYKYNIADDKWTKMHAFNNIENISFMCGSLDAKKQILFLLDYDKLSEIQLNSSNIIQRYESNQYYPLSSSKSILVNNSLFITGCAGNNSILKWDLEKKK
eukprot:107966_1